MPVSRLCVEDKDFKDNMKNKLIREYRERMDALNKDRVGIRSFIDENKKTIDNYCNKYFESENSINYVEYNYNTGKIDQIEDEILFLYSNKGEKIYLLKSRLKTKENIERELKRAKNQLQFYKERIFELCELVQLHINKLELLEETFYKLSYAVEYIEIGDKAIEINNEIKYSYYFAIYFNAFTGFESSREKLKPVFFTKEEIVKFIYENEESFV